MNRSDYPSNAAFARAVIEQTGTKTSEGTIRQRISNGETDIDKLAAPPMSRSAGARMGKKKSYFNGHPDRGSIK